MFLITSISDLKSVKISYKNSNSIIGTARIKGKKCFFYCENLNIKSVCFGKEQATQINKLLVESKDKNYPLIYFINCCGADIKEGTRSLDAYADVFRTFVREHNNQLHIAVICGNCVGGSAFLATMCDFVLFDKNSGNLCLTGPKVVKSVLGERCTKQELGGSHIQSINGTINIMYETIEECRYQLGYILDIYYNVANKVKNPIYELQNNILPLKNQPYDILKVIKGIVDADSILEISSSYAQNLVTSFARINGKSIGIVANQPKVLAGAIDCMAAEKGKNFLEKCRKLKLPLLVIVDVPSFLPGKEQERAGIEKKGGRFIKEMICLDTVKISLILHKSYGGAYIAMNCIALGADKVYSWPKSSIGIMGQSAEEEVCFDSSARQNTSEYGKYIEQGCVSEIVEPEETRDKLIKEFCSI